MSENIISGLTRAPWTRAGTHNGWAILGAPDPAMPIMLPNVAEVRTWEDCAAMAATPDMIDALYKSCAVFGLMHDFNILPEYAREAWADARAALAKARGETP